jgi:hypothetical protein
MSSTVCKFDKHVWCWYGCTEKCSEILMQHDASMLGSVYTNLQVLIKIWEEIELLSYVLGPYPNLFNRLKFVQIWCFPLVHENMYLSFCIHFTVCFIRSFMRNILCCALSRHVILRQWTSHDDVGLCA